jgi:hypothetical protein
MARLQGLILGTLRTRVQIRDGESQALMETDGGACQRGLPRQGGTLHSPRPTFALYIDGCAMQSTYDVADSSVHLSIYGRREECMFVRMYSFIATYAHTRTYAHLPQAMQFCASASLLPLDRCSENILRVVRAHEARARVAAPTRPTTHPPAAQRSAESALACSGT